MRPAYRNGLLVSVCIIAMAVSSILGLPDQIEFAIMGLLLTWLSVAVAINLS